MKYFLFIIMIFCGSSFNKVCSAEKDYKFLIPEFFFSGQALINFFNPVVAKIILIDKIDLSFYVNTEIVSQYRFRLEVPNGGETTIDKTLINWSQWINNGFRDVIVPKLDQEGRYKLIIEHKTHTNNEIKKFEKLFEVYTINPRTNPIGAKSKTLPKTGNIPTEPSNKLVVIEKSIDPYYDKLLDEAIEKKDSAMVRKSILNGAGSDIKGVNGGNIFHLINETMADEELIYLLKNRGISIDAIDNFGNTPLHIGIMSREDGYAKSLIKQRANLNIKNKVGLSPLHLSAFLNDEKIVKDLLSKGAEIDIKGNSGYTPLHIASLMNNIEVASALLNNGAKNRIKTDQKLTSRTIAKIQNNNEMFKLIGKKGSYTPSPSKSTPNNSATQLSSVKLSPLFDINLPYNGLVKKRRFNKVVQIISIPVFALSAAGTTYLKLEANKNYSLYKNAMTEDMAKFYYDKTTQYDTYTYISGGVSLISVYTFIHSTIKKKSISNKMCKTYY